MPDPTNPQSLNRYSYVSNSPLGATDPSGHMELNEGDAYQESYSEEYYHCYINPASPGCQTNWEQAGDAFLFFLGFVSAPSLFKGAIGYVSKVGIQVAGLRLLKATAEEAAEVALTGRPADPVNVGLDFATGTLDEVHTLAKYGEDAYTPRWKVGDPINQSTQSGGNPSWETVKSRYWKNAAASAEPGEYSEANLARMARGRAPLHEDLQVSMELHHVNGRAGVDPHNQNNLTEVWPWQHQAMDPQRFYRGPSPE